MEDKRLGEYRKRFTKILQLYTRSKRTFIMSQTIGQVINQLQRIGEFDIANIRMESNETTYHQINHKFRETIILPYVAIENNISYLTNKGERYIIFADGVKGKVIESSEKHICELEEDIKKLYGIDTWSFVKRWYQSDKAMDSMHFVVIKVIKEV